MEVSIKQLSYELRVIKTGLRIASSVWWDSISGLLCLSTTLEGKFVKHKAASKVALIQLR